jgi:hypothetical protein
MRRGFKKQAREISAEIRAELGVGLVATLDPWALAAHLDIPVWPLSSYADLTPGAVEHLLRREDGAFSAMLAFLGPRRIIVYNDGHAITRQRADIAHELAHALLLHDPHISQAGAPPQFDLYQEEEAAWLGGVLLVSDEFCVHCAAVGVGIEQAGEQMGVSPQLMRWRFNMSGARRRIRGRVAA